MKDDELTGKIAWCSRQKKGIKLGLPNDNLCNAYLKKSKDSLKSMHLNMNANLRDWAVDAAYYARYHAIYALLQRCGIKCEIHDCSIMLIKFLFGDKLSDGLLKELENAKINRVNLVYYTNRLVAKEEVEKNISSAPNFVLAVEKVISDLNNKEELDNIKDKLNKIIDSKNIKKSENHANQMPKVWKHRNQGCQVYRQQLHHLL